MSRTWRTSVVLWLLALAVLLPASTASAHATLLSSDPPDGAVVQSSPGAVTLTFDETVTLTDSSVQVFDARGDAVPAEVRGRDAVVSAVLGEKLTDGTYVVAWRVVSADAHPVAGSLTFSVGTPSASVTAPQVAAADDPALTRALGVTAALNYLALFLACGLVLFGLWVVRDVSLDAGIDQRLRIWRGCAAAVAVFTALNAVPLRGADDLGLGLHGMGDPSTLDLALVGRDVLVLALQVAGLVVALLLTRHRLVATTGALVAASSPAWVGHSRSHGPGLLVLPADVLHLMAGAVWLGGLVGLGLVLGSLRRRERDAATVLSRFSAIAAAVLALVTLTGVIAAWRILGSWSALVHTAYGQVLLVKVAVVAAAAGVAGFNRWRLLPRVVAEGGQAAGGEAARVVRSAVWAEASVLVVVLGLTGFLTDLSPNQRSTAGPAKPSTVSATTAGDTRVLATITPGTVGPNTVTVQLQDDSGLPLDGFAAPTVSLSSSKVDLGTVRVRPVASGTYAGQVVLPRPGTWTVQVSVRRTRFDNPVAAVQVQVRPGAS